MRILCDKNNVIIAIGEEIEFGIFENEEKWKISEHFFMIDNGFTSYDIEEQTAEVTKHCYTEDKGIFLNPNWEEDIGEDKPSIYDEIASLKNANSELRKKNEEIQFSSLDLNVRVCILEMSL